MQRVMIAAVRLVFDWRDHITPAMRDQHWLPIGYRIKYKLCILMTAAGNNNIPEYVTDIHVPNSSLQERVALPSLISDDYNLPRSKTEFGKRAFCVAGLTAWNELSLELRHMPDIQTFKNVLKTYLFNVAYDYWVLN